MPLLCHTSVSLITFMTRINVRTLTIGRMWLASLVQIFTRWILIALLCCCPVELICLPVLSSSAVRKVCIKIRHCDPIVQWEPIDQKLSPLSQVKKKIYSHCYNIAPPCSSHITLLVRRITEYEQFLRYT